MVTEDVAEDGTEQVRRRSALWAAVCCVVLAVGYVVVPVRGSPTWVVCALVVVMAAVVAAPFLLIRRDRRAASFRPVADAVVTVALMLVTLVVGFSSIYVALAHEDTASIPGLDSKVDAVYFTVTTLATVGFGDIHAASQPARVIVTIQMLFDLTVVAVAARLVLGVARERRGVRPPS